jgi:hypothetical protein
MNKEQSDKIIETAAKYSLHCRIHKLNENYILIIKEQEKFHSFKAAKFAVSAYVAEKIFAEKNQEAENLDLFPAEVIPEKEEEKELRLKISNKEKLYEFPTIMVFTSKGNVCKVQNKNYNNLNSVLLQCDMEAGEKPIYIFGTKYYSGFLIVAFDNGKVGKITMDSFKTEFNRRKLKAAYNTEADLIFIEQIDEDIELVAKSSIDKVTLFNTNQINAVGSRTTKGVQVMKPKDRSLMIKVKKLEQTNLSDPEYYRSKGLNVVGFYLKEGDTV